MDEPLPNLFSSFHSSSLFLMGELMKRRKRRAWRPKRHMKSECWLGCSCFWWVMAAARGRGSAKRREQQHQSTWNSSIKRGEKAAATKPPNSISLIIKEMRVGVELVCWREEAARQIKNKIILFLICWRGRQQQTQPSINSSTQQKAKKFAFVDWWSWIDWLIVCWADSIPPKPNTPIQFNDFELIGLVFGGLHFTLTNKKIENSNEIADASYILQFPSIQFTISIDGVESIEMELNEMNFNYLIKERKKLSCFVVCLFSLRSIMAASRL